MQAIHTHTMEHRKMLTKFYEDGEWTFFSKETHHIATSPPLIPSHSLSLARCSLSRELYTQSTRKINVAWRVSSRRRKGGKQKERTFAFQYSFSHSLTPIPAVFFFSAELLLYSSIAFTYISVVISFDWFWLLFLLLLSNFFSFSSPFPIHIIFKIKIYDELKKALKPRPNPRTYA